MCAGSCPALLYHLSPGIALRVWFDNVGVTSPTGVPAVFLGIAGGTAVFRLTSTGQIVYIPCGKVQAVAL